MKGIALFFGVCFVALSVTSDGWIAPLLVICGAVCLAAFTYGDWE